MACFVNLWLHSRTRIKWVAPRKWWCLPDGGKQEKYECHCTLGGFHLSAESNSHFALFCFTSLCDWLKNLAPLSWPIRSKSQAVRTCFPMLDAGYVYLLRVLIVSLVVSSWGNYFGLSLRHSFEKRSAKYFSITKVQRGGSCQIRGRNWGV